MQMSRKLITYILLCTLPVCANAQLGGTATYSFLDVSPSARATGVGGSFYAAPKGDVALSIANPALLGESNHQQVAFNTGFYLAGTNYGSAAYGIHSKKLKTTFGTSVNYTTYGKFDGRDPAGNPIGDFKAGNVWIGGSAARQWKKFTYAAQLKLIFSSIEQYNSFGLGVDVSAGYFHEDKNLAISMILRNLGSELKPYIKGDDKEKLPVDLALGISKRFDRLPLRLNFVAHHLHKWDLTRAKTNNNNQQIIGGSATTERGFIDKLFAHIIAGVEVEAGKPVRLRIGYDHLRRMELGSGEKKGLVGMTAGVGIVVQQFKIDYSFAKYHNVGSLNHIGIAVNLADFGNKAD